MAFNLNYHLASGRIATNLSLAYNDMVDLLKSQHWEEHTVEYNLLFLRGSDLLQDLVCWELLICCTECSDCFVFTLYEWHFCSKYLRNKVRSTIKLEVESLSIMQTINIEHHYDAFTMSNGLITGPNGILILRKFDSWSGVILKLILLESQKTNNQLLLMYA